MNKLQVANIMKNAEKLKKQMQPGKVYRRQDLKNFTTAVDRDLQHLVEKGQVKKLAGGMYSRLRQNAFGAAPPADQDLVRTFLKSDNFLLTSYNHFNALGLGLTQVYKRPLVYNHKRSGEFFLAGKPFEFRVVPEYPRKLDKEFLLVDLLNNLNRLPDDTSRVLQNLKSRLPEFDQEKLWKYLDRYGKPSARKLIEEMHG